MSSKYNNSITQKIKKYKHCDSRFYPYIEEVLLRIPEDVRLNEILDDTSLEIISFGCDSTSGRFYNFDDEKKSVVMLNDSILDSARTNIIHTIVHELAHKVTGRGLTGLWEKEAEELVKQWGFEKESDEIDYHRPAMEIAGYDTGYKWASQQDDLDAFEEFYHDWDENSLTPSRMEEVMYVLDPSSILHVLNESTETSTETSADTKIYPNDGSLDKGILYGVMGYIKEQKQKMKASKTEGEAVLIETLEKVLGKLNELYANSAAVQALWEYEEKKPEIIEDFANFTDEVGIFLQEIKENNQKR